jgi:hypothetical protein
MVNDAEALAARLGIPLIIAFLAVGIRLLFSTSRVTFFGITRSILVAVFVGLLAANYVIDIPNEVMGNGWKGIIIAAMAILAEDLVFGVRRLGRKFRIDPESFISFVINTINKFLGRG